MRIILKEREFFDLGVEPDVEPGKGPDSVYRLYIDLVEVSPKVTEQVQSVIYGIVTEPYTLEKTQRSFERGASGTEVEILVAVMSGLAANVGSELLKGLANKIGKSHVDTEEKARYQALYYLNKATDLNPYAFELLYYKELGHAFVYMFRERATDKKHYINMSKKLAVVEYRVFAPHITPPEQS